jgi:O-acetyl-ADP-ribose deacetylase (regulator of RNase III)
VIELLEGDLTTLAVDAIVNAANSALGGGGGVDGAIHRAAGPALLRASRALAPCPPGEARVTPGFLLPARWVIHTVGPIWQGGTADEDAVLARAYRSSLACAAELGAQSLAFPCISTGAYGFPAERAAAIALDVLHAHEDRFARLVVFFNDTATTEIYTRLLAGERP